MPGSGKRELHANRIPHPSAPPGALLFEHRWQGRRVMIHDQPGTTALDESKAVARGERLFLPVLEVRERVIAGVDGGVAIHANELLAESYLQRRQRSKR